MKRRTACGAVVIVVLGCSSENGVLRGTQADDWTIAAEPLLSIGGDVDHVDPLYQVAGAARVPEGILIANGGTRDLRLYDNVGQLVTTTGREGRGPGEFRFPRMIGRLPGDSVVVYDSGNRRVTVACSDGRICAEWEVRVPGRVIGIAGDHVVMEVGVTAVLPTTPAARSRQAYLRTRRQGEVLDTLLQVDGQTVHAGASGNTTMRVPALLTRGVLSVVGTIGAVVNNGRDPAMTVINLESGRHVTVQVAMDLHPISDEEWSSAADNLIRNAPPDPGAAVMERIVQSMSRPTHRPPFRRLLLDASNLIWAELDQPDANAHAWLVLDTTGSTRAHLMTPRGLSLLEIGDDYVLGLWRDTLDIEFVQMHRLNRR